MVGRTINNATDKVSVLIVLVEITEMSIETKLIDSIYTYYYDSSFITYLLEFVIDDIIFVLQRRVGFRNSTYLLDEEVGQLIFDTFENIVNMCIYSNKNTNVSIINGQLSVDTTTTTAQLLISDSILDKSYNAQMDSLTMETNKIACNDHENMFANDTLTSSNEYIKQQRELVLNTNISSSNSNTNDVFLDYSYDFKK